MGDVLRSAHAQCISGDQMKQTGESSDDVLNTQQILWHQAQGGVVDHGLAVDGGVSLAPKALSGLTHSSTSVSYQNLSIACVSCDWPC